MTGSSDIRVKMCGLTTPEQAQWACEAGASYVGLVFFPPSPRNVSLAAATEIAASVPDDVTKVALAVDPDDALLDDLAGLAIDLVQLHGREPPMRVAQVRQRLALPVMKAVGIRDAADLAALDAYDQVVDQLLVDAKPPKDATLPGGNGLSFDWQLLSGRDWPLPWMLAGGLTPENVAEAIQRTGAQQVDVSSGIESAPGQKDPARIRAFMDAIGEI